MKFFSPPVWLAVATTVSLLGTTFATPPVPLCRAFRPPTYAHAKHGASNSCKATLEVVETMGITPWYTDNDQDQLRNDILRNMTTSCGTTTKIPMVIYGLPHKNCDPTHPGSNKDITAYKSFIDHVAKESEKHHMLYVIEPGALALLAQGECGAAFKDPLIYAVTKLSENPNAELYVDVAKWALDDKKLRHQAAEAFRSIASSPGVRMKGFALNTASYHYTNKGIKSCNQFIKTVDKANAMGYKCVIDTSRNQRGLGKNKQWCNAHNAGIGEPPSAFTRHPNVAYYLWNKPPGESDGTCMDEKNTPLENSMADSPPAGQFFKAYFKLLWRNGFLFRRHIRTPEVAVTYAKKVDMGQHRLAKRPPHRAGWRTKPGPRIRPGPPTKPHPNPAYKQIPGAPHPVPVPAGPHPAPVPAVPAGPHPAPVPVGPHPAPVPAGPHPAPVPVVLPGASTPVAGGAQPIPPPPPTDYDSGNAHVRPPQG